MVNEVLAAALTLLVKLNVFTEQEISNSIKNGYDALFNLVNEKYKKLVEQGAITHND